MSNVYSGVGYTFNNYHSNRGEWGVPLTSDDIRLTYLAGIDLTLSNGQEVHDEQIDSFIEMSMSEIERALDIIIRKRIYRTNYRGSERRSPIFRNDNLDKWTHIGSPFPFKKRDWESNGYIALPHRPLISVERAILKTPVDSPLIDLVANNWIREYPSEGRLQLYPRNNSGYNYGPFLGSAGLILNRLYGDYADGYEFDYTVGYENSDFIPPDLRQIIGELSAVACLSWIGDGLLVGFSASNISIDGLSESFNSTQSATSAYFGARIIEYRRHITEYVKRNRFKFAQIPFLSA